MVTPLRRELYREVRGPIHHSPGNSPLPPSVALRGTASYFGSRCAHHFELSRPGLLETVHWSPSQAISLQDEGGHCAQVP